jgi:hypothetical protein
MRARIIKRGRFTQPMLLPRGLVSHHLAGLRRGLASYNCCNLLAARQDFGFIEARRSPAGPMADLQNLAGKRLRTQIKTVLSSATPLTIAGPVG